LGLRYPIVVAPMFLISNKESSASPLPSAFGAPS
jgi:hypothetical protein